MSHFTLSEEDITEFQALYLARFGKTLSADEARVKAAWLVRFVAFVCALDDPPHFVEP